MPRCRVPLVVLATMLVVAGFLANKVHASSQDTLLIIDVADTLGAQGTAVPVSIYLTNLADSIAGFTININLSRNDLMEFTTSTLIDTCFHCRDSACTRYDTVLCTVQVVPSSVQGTLIQNWDHHEARTFGGTSVRLSGIADVDFNRSPLPILPFTNGVLMKVVAHVFCNIPDTLTDRTVVFEVSPNGTIFTDPKGDTISTAKLLNGSVTVPFSLKGDLDHNGVFDVLDVVREVNVAFRGAPPACPPGVDDLDCNGFVDILDVVRLVNHVFRGGPRPNC